MCRHDLPKSKDMFFKNREIFKKEITICGNKFSINYTVNTSLI